MNDGQKLDQIAKLFGGMNKLGKEIGLDGSGVSRRIQGETKITNRDWICIKSAVEKRVDALHSAIA